MPSSVHAARAPGQTGALPRQPAAPAPLFAAAPVVPRRARRTAAAVLALVVGAGLLGGAAVGGWLNGEGAGAADEETVFDERRALWRELPVDGIFPAELTGEGAGPGGADRRWLRTSVAPDAGCDEAFDGSLPEAVATVGCHRLLRATYRDETETSVTTVGLLFTEADPAETAALRASFAEQDLGRDETLRPTHYPPATEDADATAVQRSTWTVRALADVPVVVYAVTGFADGRAAGDPQPAGDALADGADSVVALAGLGHDAAGVADRVERRLRKEADTVETDR